jgi:hypothetical protein
MFFPIHNTMERVFQRCCIYFARRRENLSYSRQTYYDTMWYIHMGGNFQKLYTHEIPVQKK